MLKKIIFIIEDKNPLNTAPLYKALKRIGNKLKRRKIAVIIELCRKEEGLSYLLDELNKELEIKNSLFITDLPEVLDACLHSGYYAIAYMHAGNNNMWQAKYAVERVEELDYESFLQAYQRLAGLPWHITDTKQLTIRETTQEDIEAFYQIYQEPSITYYMENLFENIEDEREYMKAYIEKIYGFYGYGIWTLLLKKTGEVIGRAGLSWREGYPVPELGFMIGSRYQRRGYAYEACKKILTLAKTRYEFEQIQALVEAENEASINLCNKLGFRIHDNITEKDKKYLLFVKKV